MIYTFENKITGEEQTLSMKMSDREPWLDDNPEWFQVLNTMTTGDPIKLGITKPPIDFQREVLGRIKRGSGKGSSVGDTRWSIPVRDL